MSVLPSSWARAELVEVLQANDNGKPFQQGWSPQCESSSASDDRWGVLKTTAIQSGEFWDVQNKQLPAHLEPRPSIEVKAGDVLMTCAGPRSRCGVVCLVERTRPHLMMSGKMYRFRPHPQAMDSKYLTYFIQTREAQLSIDRMKTGISDSGLNLTHDRFAKLEISVAPLNEQRRIVAKIEELFSELDKGVESLKTAQQQLKAYRQAVINRAVDGGLVGLSSFPRKRLSTVVEELGQGWSPRCLSHPASDDETWAVITTTAIQHGLFQQQQNKQLPEDLEPRPHLAIGPGDVLITRAGPRKRVGVACMVRDCRPRLMLCDKAYRLRVDLSQVLPEWLELILNSPSILQEIEKLKTGISDSGVNLTQDRFLELEVTVPTLPEQQAVLQASSALTLQMSNLEGQIEVAMRQSDALRQSILKHAFSGQLVPQDPNDEPASVLLARIKAEKANAANGAKKKKDRAA